MPSKKGLEEFVSISSPIQNYLGNASSLKEREWGTPWKGGYLKVLGPGNQIFGLKSYGVVSVSPLTGQTKKS